MQFAIVLFGIASSNTKLMGIATGTAPVSIKNFLSKPAILQLYQGIIPRLIIVHEIGLSITLHFYLPSEWFCCHCTITPVLPTMCQFDITMDAGFA